MTTAESKPCLRPCRAILMLLVAADVVSDWLFYADVAVSKKGLVFGPVNPTLVEAILAFTIIGSLLALLEIYIIYKETFDIESEGNDNDDCILDGLNLIVLVGEDIPQVILLLVVSLCRPEPDSVFQYMKAAFSLLSCFIKAASTFYAMVRGKCNSLKKALLVLAFVELVLSIVVFIAAKAKISNTGAIYFVEPDTISKDKYQEEVYFTNVSVFMTLKLQSSSNVNPVVNHWLHLASIDRIKDCQSISFRVESQDNIAKGTTWLRVVKQEHGGWDFVGCYSLDRDGFAVPLERATCNRFLSAPSVLEITFKYDNPDEFFKSRLLGDITFKAKYRAAGGNQMTDLDAANFTESTSDPGPDVFAILRYFKHKPQTKSAAALKEDRCGPRTYHNDGCDLLDIKDIWVTGLGKCHTTGNLGPRWKA